MTKQTDREEHKMSFTIKYSSQSRETQHDLLNK